MPDELRTCLLESEKFHAAVDSFQKIWFNEDKIQKFWFSAKSKKNRNFIETMSKEFLDLLVLFSQTAIDIDYSFLKSIDLRTKVHFAVFLDQASRNARAVDLLKQSDVECIDQWAVAIMDVIGDDCLSDSLTVPEFCFATLIWRHTKNQSYIAKSESILLRTKKKDPLIDRFLQETIAAKNRLIAETFIQKALNYDTPTLKTRSRLDLDKTVLDESCKFQVESFQPSCSGLVDELLFQILADKLKPFKRVLLSLSGGVDSMAHLLLLSKIPNIDLVALNMSYPLNRNESICTKETDWLAVACESLNVEFYQYEVLLKRPHDDDQSGIDRGRFESVTKQIRFRMYELLKADAVILGHHSDDRDENAIEQLGRGHLIGDLGGIHESVTMHGVLILRPLIERRKNEFYEICEKYNFIFFKDSTPVWSVRGQTRTVLNKIIETHSSDFQHKLTNAIKLSLDASHQLDNLTYHKEIEYLGIEVLKLSAATLKELCNKFQDLNLVVAQVANAWNAALSHFPNFSIQRIKHEKDLEFAIFEKALVSVKCQVFADSITLKAINHLWESRPQDESNKSGGFSERIAFLWKGTSEVYLYETAAIRDAKQFRKALLLH